jgi:hypothetical protein
MQTGFLVAIGVAILCSILGALYPWSKQLAEARQTRMAQHRMNARLLRFNI